MFYTILLFSTFVFITIYLSHKYVKYRAAVDQIPGPPVKSWLMGNLDHLIKPVTMSKDEFLKEYFDRLTRLFASSSKEGVTRLWLGPFHVLYFLTNAETIQKLLNSSTNLDKGVEYKFLNPWLGDGLLLAKSDQWKLQRRLLTTAFHQKTLQDFLPIFENHTKILLEKIATQLDANPNYRADIRPLFEDLTLNVVKETSMGLDGSYDESRNETYQRAIKYCFIGALNRLLNPLHWVDFAFGLSRKGKQFYKHVQFLREYGKKVIMKRVEALRQLDSNNNTTSQKCADSLLGKIVIDILLKDSMMNSASRKLNSSVIIAQVNTFISGGFDTTAMAMTFATFLIGHHPEVQEKIYQELEEVLADDMTRDLTINDLRQMTYLEQCICESLRLYPSILVIGRQLSQPLTLPSGKVIPSGASCHVPIACLHRDPTHFPEPDRFIPERFSPENKPTSQYAFIPFSAGPRNCIGKRYAMLEIKYVLANVFRKYKVRTVTKTEDIRRGLSPILKSLKPIEVQFERV